MELPADEADDLAQVLMGRWFIEECEKDEEVARIAIEALEEKLDAFSGPAEGARAKSALRRFIEVATRPRMELVGFPQVSKPNP